MKTTTADMRNQAIEIFQAGLRAVSPGTAIKSRCWLQGDTLTVADRDYDLGQYQKIFVIGAGKAGASMAKAIEDILGDRLTQGLISVKYDHLETLKKIKILEAAHPFPDENGLAAARTIFELASSADRETLVICLISGGGSALLPLPAANISLPHKQDTTKVLLACGATIHEINAIRKHLSVIKGGGLARAVYPATLVTLILSDVVGDDLDSIASGPTVPDHSTYADCLRIFDKYRLNRRILEPVMTHLRRGAAGEIPETPKPDEDIFSRTQNVIVASNYDALIKAKEKADSLGYNTLLLSSMLEGETREVAANHIAIAREIQKHGQPLKVPACLLSGGETTVRIKGTGKGGRNQEFSLAAAVKADGMEKVVILSAGTDGSDGPTDAAGALADPTTLARAEQLGLNVRASLDNNDSYPFFDRLGDLYKTGPTNTNVMDLRIILIN